MFTRHARRAVAFIGAALLAAIHPAHAEPSIEWEVAVPFRLIPDFKSDSDFVKEYRAHLAKVSSDATTPPVLAIERLLRKGDQKDWASKLLEKDLLPHVAQRASCWHMQQHRYMRPSEKDACSDFIKPQKHDIVARIMESPTSAGNLCRWTLDGQPFDGTAPRSCVAEVRGSVPHTGQPHRLVALRIAEDGTAGELAGTDVLVEDLLIGGLGDSFASGEGNPDRPVHLSASHAYRGRYPIRAKKPVENWKDGSLWHDQACHRSFHSQQLRAALHLALAERHRSVGFIGLACSGAEIGEGLLGAYGGVEPDFRYDKSVSSEERNRPQLKALLAVLCGNDVSRVSDEGNDENRRFRCKGDLTRRLDLLFLSIGGNDIGFSGLVAYTLLHDAPASVVAYLLDKVSKKFVFSPKDGAAKIDETRKWFASLNEAFQEAGVLKDGRTSRILLTTYPMPIQMSAPPVERPKNPRTDESLCPEGKAGMEFFDVTLTLSFDRKRAGKVREVADSLLTMMGEAAKPWQFVTDHQTQFHRHGFCNTDAKERLDLPVMNGGTWSPDGSNPAGYQPYEPRARWFRTPNDAYMVVNHHGNKDFVGQENTPDWANVWRHGYLLTGGMHPTAEGHAAIADHVVCVARNVLAGEKGGTGCGKVE